MANSRAIRAGKAFVELFADNKRLVRGLRQAERKLKAFGDKVRGIGTSIAAVSGLAAAPMVVATKLFSSMGDQVAKMAKRTGFGVEALSELTFVASQTGTSLEAMETGFRRMQRSIYDAGRGLSTQTDALSDLGLEYKDLAGLAPEKQFKMLAEAISRIEDPTRKAALAQALFGRAGTQLLPMMADGAAGIEALQKQARQLGLTMSNEDAASAEAFTDAIDRLWKSLKMAAFQAGAALAPAIQAISDQVTGVVVKIRYWVDKNRDLVETAGKVVAVSLGVGVALIALGTIISGLGAAVGMLAGVISAVGSAFAAMGAIIGAILTPIGLVVAAVAALGTYLVTATKSGGKALDWLSDRFGALRDFAIETWGAIGDALAAGDIELAAKVLWTSLKLAWLKGTAGLRKMWHDFIFGLQALWEGLGYELGNVWRRVVHGLKSTWNDFEKFMKDSRTALGMMWSELVNDTKHNLGQITDEQYEANVQRIRLEGGKDFMDAEAEHSRRQRAEQKAHQKSMVRAAEAHKAAMLAIGKENDARVKGAKDALDAAIKGRNEALAKARQYGGMRTGGDGPSGPGDPSAKLKSAFEGLDAALQSAASAGMTRGTFSGSNASLLGLQTSTWDRMAEDLDRIARNTKPLRNAGKATFTT